MDNVPNIQPPSLPPLNPLAPNITNEVGDPKEKTPIPSKKFHALFWIIIGLVISAILIGIVVVVWKLAPSGNTPDLVINAPEPSESVVSQDVVFESQPYRNESAGFEISVPLGWKIDDSSGSGATVVISDPKVTVIKDHTLLTFVSVSTGQTRDTLENEVKKIKEGLQKAFDSYVISEDDQMVIDKNTYRLLDGSYTLNGNEIKNRNLILIFNKKGYAVSVTAPQSVWSKKESLLNALLFSFKNI
jgi:hypothetical protein